MTLWLHPNVGAEERRRGAPPQAVADVVRLFTALFPEGARRTDAPDAAAPALGLAKPPPAWAWLAQEQGLFAWLNDEESARAGSCLHGATELAPRSAGRPLAALSEVPGPP